MDKPASAGVITKGHFAMKRFMKLGGAVCVTVISTTLLITPALAGDGNGFGVGTSAATGQYLDIYGGVAGSVAAYRMGTDPSGNYTRMGDVAPVSFNNCGQGGNPNCIASQGGTLGPGFDQTFSTSNSGMIYTDAGGARQVAASTYANLSTGKLGASGSTGYYQTASTVSKFLDTLSFTVAGADAATTTNIVIKFQLDGSLTAPIVPNGTGGLAIPTASITDSFGFGGANAMVGFNLTGNDLGGPRDLQTRSGQNGWVSYSWDTISPGLTQFTGVYSLSGFAQTLGISNSLSGFASTGGSFAYGNTSSLSFILPGNVTFTSASGKFLTGLVPGGGAVPEPATWTLMLLGFGMVGHALRQGKRAALPA